MGELALLERPALPACEPLSLPQLRVFVSVPDHCGVVSLRGTVVVFDPDPLHREGVRAGSFYVLENQHTPACMQWRRWLREELGDEHVESRAQPRSPLKTSRHVVQLIRDTRLPNHWTRRLESGFCDGPYQDWSIGFNLVGKVVGIYRPS